MNWINFYSSIHKSINNVTPLYFDCGELCNKACCSSINNNGMMLFPNEDLYINSIENDFIINNGDNFKLLICKGTCNRAIRPLSCIIYPLFPYLYNDERLDLKLDPRAYNKCPLFYSDIEQLKLQPLFRLKLFKIFENIKQNKEINIFLKRITIELLEIEKFIK